MFLTQLTESNNLRDLNIYYFITKKKQNSKLFNIIISYKLEFNSSLHTCSIFTDNNKKYTQKDYIKDFKEKTCFEYYHINIYYIYDHLWQKIRYNYCIITIVRFMRVDNR